MYSYQEIKSGANAGQALVGYRRLEDGATIPADPANADYQLALSEIAAGATVEPADAPPVRYVETLPYQAQVTTTDATVTEVFRQTLPPLVEYWFDVRLGGVDRGNGACLRFEAKYTVKRLNAGVLLVGSPTIVVDHRDAGAASWVVSPQLAGNDVVLRVTGAAGRTIDWAFGGEASTYAPGGLGV